MRFTIIFLCLASACLAQSASESFCTEILRLYPTEFVDQTAWWETCVRAHDLDALIQQMQDPLIGPVDTIAMSDVIYQPNKASTTGYLKITGFHGGDAFVALFDAELEKARFDDGLLLDLRGAGGGEIETAYKVLSRLAPMKMEGVRVRRRIPGSENTRESAYFAVPRGEWQFDKPIVVLVDGGTHWPSQVILWAERDRTQMETVGVPTMGLKAVEPHPVTLPGNMKIQIPTATLTTINHVQMTGQAYEPDLNLNKEPATVYRDPKDPILYRATDELYRILGRLEWLREELRKQIEEESTKSGK